MWAFKMWCPSSSTCCRFSFPSCLHSQNAMRVWPLLEGEKTNKQKLIFILPLSFLLSLYFLQRVLYLGSQRNLSSCPSSLHINHSLKEAWFSILLPSFLRNRKGDSCSRRCINSAQGSAPRATVPALTTSNNWKGDKWKRRHRASAVATLQSISFQLLYFSISIFCFFKWWSAFFNFT